MTKTVSPEKGSLKTLARELNLSITTVSRALGGYSDVASATRERVVEAAARRHYVPNSAAKMLVTGRSGYIGLLLPLMNEPFSDPFLGDFIAGLGESLAARQHDLVINAVAPSQTEMQVLRRTVESGQVDGIVLTRIGENDERVEFLRSRRIPFVTHGRTLTSKESDNWIDTDGEQAFFAAAELLLSLGHQRIALMSIAEQMTFRHVRERGVSRALQGATNIDDVSLTLHYTQRFDQDQCRRLVRELLTQPQRPTAILALTDDIALIVLNEANAMGLSVPDDLSIIGFGNIPQAAVVPPGLSTFDQSTRQTAALIGHRIVDSIEGQLNIQQQLVQPFFVARGTHGPAPHKGCPA